MMDIHSLIWNFIIFQLIIISLIVQINAEEKTSLNIAVIPFKTYFPINYNLTDVKKQLINSYIYSKIYFYIEVSSGQKIPMFLNFEQAQIHTSEKIVYFRDEDIENPLYSFNCSHICNYNYKNSNSYTHISDSDKLFYNWPYCIASEKMIFYKDLKNKQKSTYEVQFLHISNGNLVCFLSGIYDTPNIFDKPVSLFYQIKNLINSNKFTWSLYYDTQNEGKFIIGDIIGNKNLEFYNENKKENYIALKQSAFGEKIFWKFQADTIYIGNYINKISKAFDIVIYNRYISVTKDLFSDIKRQYLIDTNKENNLCFEEETDKNKQTGIYNYLTIYCNKKKYLSLTDNYKKLKDFTIYLSEVKQNISFTPKELFIEKGDYVYFFIREDRKKDSYSIGSILLEKYVTVFDDDAKILYILKQKSYSNIKEEKDNTTFKIVLIAILIFIFCAIVFFIIGKLYGKKIFRFRKKKANELDDDDFDYTPKNINEGKNNNEGLLDDNEENGGS